ncbi:hypothetical protein [Streptomyces sp. NPDC088196]|uniref:hypothetical protein n=1 Tax=Streptomyces sp. NPDC088196 TaxID=3154868 RepID=UPI00344FE686
MTSTSFRSSAASYAARLVPLLTDRRCVLVPAAASPTVSLADHASERRVLESGRTRFLAACRDAGFAPGSTPVPSPTGRSDPAVPKDIGDSYGQNTGKASGNAGRRRRRAGDRQSHARRANC